MTWRDRHAVCGRVRRNLREQDGSLHAAPGNPPAPRPAPGANRPVRRLGREMNSEWRVANEGNDVAIVTRAKQFGVATDSESSKAMAKMNASNANKGQRPPGASAEFTLRTLFTPNPRLQAANAVSPPCRAACGTVEPSRLTERRNADTMTGRFVLRQLCVSGIR